MIPKSLQIPGYDIEELLGKGGMAAVYKARQQSFGREVALKVLNPAAEDLAEFSRRFMQESLIVAKLHHSHIVQVYDVGQHEIYFYISMEYLHGGDLSTKLQTGLTLKESVRIAKQLADALDFAHRKHIIHRDIKPANIMFREDDAAVLTDFGVAKELESQTDLTQAGVVIGTPKYMSPEQIRGDKVDHRTDIYALGIVLYRCLTNYVPFDGKDMVTTAYLQDNEPVPTLPVEVACFQPIINRMLEKSPEDRFQRGRDIVTALEEIERRVTLPNLTNLDVAAASQAAPPSVTHSTSGRYSVKNPGKTYIKRDFQGTTEGTQIRTRESLNETILADHIVPADSLLDSPLDSPLDSSLDTPLDEHPVELPPKSRFKSSAVLLGLVSVGALTFPANLYSGKFSGTWSQTLSQVSDGISKSWTQISGDSSSAAATHTGNPVDPIAASKPLPPAAEIPFQEQEQVSGSAISASAAPGEPASSEPVMEPAPPLAEAPTDPQQSAEAALTVAVLSPDAASTLDEIPADVPGTESASDETAASEGNAAPAATTEPAEPDTTAIIATLLTEAEANMAQRRLRKPANDNAYLKFQQVLELDAQNAEALTGIDKIADTYIAMSGHAITQQQLDKARGFLEEARAIAPEKHQLATLEEKLFLAMAAKEAQEIEAAALQRAAKIEELLTSARADETAGRIRAPFGNNALEKYQRILELDPDNAHAIDKLIEYGR